MSDKLRLEIDEFKLDEEWMGQAKLRREWGEKHADAIFEMDEAKSKLAVVEAELGREMRNDPEEFDLGKKATEAAIKGTIPLHSKHQVATRNLNEAKHAAKILEAAVEGIEHRKRALEKLVDLHGRDYFGDKPRPSKENKEAVEEMEKRTIRRRGRRKVNRDDE